MAVIGIIAEFNPLHTGHNYLIKEAKKLGTVAAVISGNFVQRGDVAIFDKRIRAEAALTAGVDIVLELPVCYSMSTAQNFALGGVSALKAIGCDTLMFGSECGDVEILKQAAEILKSEKFKLKLTEILDTGVTFANAREQAAVYCGLEDGILSSPNNNLAVEYILASKNINVEFNFLTVKRQGVEHDALREGEGFASASLLREKLRLGDYDFCKEYIPENILPIFKKESIADIGRIETAILAVLRTKTEADLKKLPDLSEGLENKLFSAIKVAKSLDGLYNKIKVKRYTEARIRRLVLSAFLNVDNSFFMKAPPYIRVLGFNSSGAELLKNESFGIPIVTRVSQIAELSNDAEKLFEFECRATDLFGLSVKEALPCGTEYTAKLIKKQ